MSPEVKRHQQLLQLAADRQLGELRRIWCESAGLPPTKMPGRMIGMRGIDFVREIMEVEFPEQVFLGREAET